MKVLSRAEQRIKWLTSQDRALTESEADELYKSLKQLEYRQRHAAKVALEGNAPALAKHAEETKALLARVEAEARPKSYEKRRATFEENLAAVREGRATIYVMPAPVRKEYPFTLGGVSAGLAA